MIFLILIKFATYIKSTLKIGHLSSKICLKSENCLSLHDFMFKKRKICFKFTLCHKNYRKILNSYTIYVFADEINT